MARLKQALLRIISAFGAEDGAATLAGGKPGLSSADAATRLHISALLR